MIRKLGRDVDGSRVRAHLDGSRVRAHLGEAPGPGVERRRHRASPHGEFHALATKIQ